MRCCALCASAHSAQVRAIMRILYIYAHIMLILSVYAHMMRICANYAYMRILCVDAQMMRICAEYAYMRILRVYAPYGRGRKTLRIPRENGPGGRGLWKWDDSAPSLSCLVFQCVSGPQDPLTYIYPQARHTPARGGGGLPLPAAAAAAP